MLTSFPAPYRAQADQALLFVANLRERLTTIALDESDYRKVLDAAAASGLTGGAVFDVLLGQAALKSRAQAVYT